MVDDDEIKKMITSMCNTDEKNYPLNELSSKICKQFTENKLDSIGNSWKTKCSNKDLLLILKEAIKLHKEGYYFGSTSLLMFQVSGLIKEISKYAIDNNLEINKDDEMTACKLLNVEYNDHIKRIEKNKNRASERHLMLRLMVYPKKGEFYWYAVTEYIYNIIFTNKEFDLITCLAENPDRIFSKDELFEKIWKYDSMGETSTVTVHVNRIREKIFSVDKEFQYINTVWGRGYRFNK